MRRKETDVDMDKLLLPKRQPMRMQPYEEQEACMRS